MKRSLTFAAAFVAVMPMLGEEVSDSSRVVDLDEVLVVAQPKEVFRLRQQSLSSNVFGQQEMLSYGISDLRSLSDFVPSLAIPSYGSRYTSSIYIRGIGSRVNSPSVGVYVDNIPVVNKSMMNTHLYGLERADVLRGPQGTLYGQNTEGGLLRLYTPSPLRHQGTELNLGLGTHFQRKAEVMHHRLLSERLGLSVGGFYEGQNGFFKNQATGDRADEINEGGARARLSWNPSAQWEADVTADYQYVDQNGFPYGVYDADADRTANPSTNRQGTYRRHQLTGGLSVVHHGDVADLNYTGSWQYLRDNMLMDIDYRPQDYMYMEQAQLQNAMTHELTVKSRKKGPWQWTFGAFGSAQWLKTIAPVHFENDMDQFLGNTIRTAMVNSMLASADQAWRSIVRFYPTTPMDQLPALYRELVMQTTIDTDLETVPGSFRTPQFNLGLFHESNISLTDRLTATLGLRYDFAGASIKYQTSARMVSTAVVPAYRSEATNDLQSVLKNSRSSTFSQLLPKIGLSWRIGPRQDNVYAVVSKGYRAGGYNIQMFSDILQAELQNNSSRSGLLEHTASDYEAIDKTISYKPEESWNYEAGAHLSLFDGLLQADIAGYYMQIRHQQLSVMSGNYGFGRMMVNAGKSYSCGVEATLRGAALNNHLHWSATYSYTHAVFKEYTDSVAEAGRQTPVSYKDKRVPFVPEHQFSATADYRIDLGKTLRSITLGAQFTGQGSLYWDEANTQKQKFYTQLGAHADADFGHVVLSLWGRNLTDSRYNTFAVSSNVGGNAQLFAQRGNPFNAGFDVRVKF